MRIHKQQPYFLLALVGTIIFCLVKNIHCGLQPYYIHFPPPVFPGTVLPVPNGLEPIDFPYRPWPSRNSTLARNLPEGHIPLILHTWVKPDSSEGVKLQNGTIIYYVSPPWGGIRASTPTTPASPQATTTLSNSLSTSDDFSLGGNGIERQSLFEDPNRQSGYPSSGGLKPPTIDITAPPPSRNGSPWGHGHLGFGWPTATQLYDKLPETSTTAATTITGTNPTRSQISDNPTTTTTEAQKQTGTSTTTTEKATTTSSTTTADPVAANTNARFPVSDSVRKFRRIVAQIRAITKQELAAPRKSKS